MASRNGRQYLKDEDFEEGEIWGVMEERENSSPKKLRKSSLLFKNNNNNNNNSSFFSSSTKHGAPRMIPRSSSSPSSSSSEKQSSAPVAIPDWSKIYGKNCKNGAPASSWVDYGNNGGYFGNNNGVGYDHGDDDVDDGHHGHGDDDDDDDGVVPPHEFLARKLARSQISSFSVYEGIGRTLKGRDLSKVRNAILTKTGFLEQ